MTPTVRPRPLPSTTSAQAWSRPASWQYRNMRRKQTLGSNLLKASSPTTSLMAFPPRLLPAMASNPSPSTASEAQKDQLLKRSGCARIFERQAVKSTVRSPEYPASDRTDAMSSMVTVFPSAAGWNALPGSLPAQVGEVAMLTMAWATQSTGVRLNLAPSMAGISRDFTTSDKKW
eukprot:CAMPEP_0115485236 /NCGR_PEP_ID=MMETSP0271-20121206/59804_1 /TAXON_ID=71861 /ORGANISM="Scrippsiella trochoidea, Strain CCMP3099" /LENGTH=174 /DNA_ID=CAMNT_0002913185 /DNA_START=147 /DNA_END=671 /DNA_ORIENTATION=+